MDGPRAASEQDESGPSAAMVTREIAAEASVWIARLHGPDRSPQMERECLAWQARSAAHRLAFERCTEVWEGVPGVRLADAYATASSRGPVVSDIAEPVRSRRTLVLALAVAIAGGGLWGWHLWRDAGLYATAVGEQRLVILDDGSRMTLNTDTRARVNFGPTHRTVTVEDGEALFEVAKDSDRPFIVRVAGSEVVAVGTVFSVRLAGGDSHATDQLAITLIEGQVTVRPAPGNGADDIAPARPHPMQAGERMRLGKPPGTPSGSASERVDRPSIEQLVAWKRSEAIFDDVSLADAVVEMNRYNRTPIVLVGSASLAQLRVSGLYHTGDSAGFARAVAALHGLVARERAGRLELAAPQ